MPEVIAALEGFLQEHRRCGDPDGGVDGGESCLTRHSPGITSTALIICLLAVTASAQGKGAWVLWMQSTTGGRPEYTKIDSFPRDVPGRPQTICTRWAKTSHARPQIRNHATPLRMLRFPSELFRFSSPDYVAPDVNGQ